MSLEIGIIGLPGSGKTTIFQAITSSGADRPDRPREATPSYLGTARVPDHRLEVLSGILQPRKVTPVEARFIDVGASVQSPGRSQGISGEILNRLSKVDSLIGVVRSFRDASVPHPQGSIDIHRDIKALQMELAFSDLAILEKRLEKLEDSIRMARPAERQALVHEKETLLPLKSALEKETPLRELTIDPVTEKAISSYQFLTAKPLLIVINIGEDEIAAASSLEEDLNRRYARPSCRAIAICGRLEMELARLDGLAAAEFRADYGLKEPGGARIMKASYEISGLISFFTIVSGEVRAWPVKRGTTALRAAGKIHSDMARGFIRAEGISFADLVECGSIAEAKRRGRLRLEGKDYVVQDGDIITFLFNV